MEYTNDVKHDLTTWFTSRYLDVPHDADTIEADGSVSTWLLTNGYISQAEANDYDKARAKVKKERKDKEKRKTYIAVTKRKYYADQDGWINLDVIKTYPTKHIWTYHTHKEKSRTRIRNISTWFTSQGMEIPSTVQEVLDAKTVQKANAAKRNPRFLRGSDTEEKDTE